MSKEIMDGFRLSPQQERLWLLQAAGGGAAYRSQCAILIEGPLDADALRRSLAGVVERHEILRTAFSRPPEMALPMQVITNGGIEWEEVEGFALPSGGRDAWNDALLRAAGERAFDYERGEVLRASLLRLSPQSHLLIVTTPALCADATGLNNLLAELARNYASSRRNENSDEAPLQYADVSELLNEMVEAEDTAPGREYWRRQDILSVSMPSLAFERSPAGTSFTPEAVSQPLGAECEAGVTRLAQQLGVAPEHVLCAAWYAQLWRYLKQEMLVVGVEFTLRKYGPLSDALGLFAKHLPLKRRVDGRQSFAALVEDVRAAAGEAYNWQESFSWEQLGGEQVAGTHVRRYAPYAFAFAEYPPPTRARGLTFSLSRQFVCHDRFKLKLCGVRCPDGSLSIEVQFDAGLFGAEDARRLASQFRCLLSDACVRPEVLLEELQLLDEAGRAHVLADFNPARRKFEGSALVHELVELQAARTPDAPALVASDSRLTYAELNARANRLARRLAREGVGPEDIVGVCVERSVEMIVGLLAILKAGGAYLPLDPHLPPRRLGGMLAEARPRIVLVTRQSIESLLIGEVPVIYLDDDAAPDADEGTMNLVQTVSPASPAYVIYTSGSTGKPKGVVIPHAAIRNRLLWLQTVYALTPHDVLLQKTVFSFDASVWEIFVPLLSGACLVLAEPGGEQDASYLVRAIAENEVTILQLVPSMLALLLEESGVESLHSLRRVFCGGEALPYVMVERHRQLLGAELVNLYGPTEASIDATYFECSRESFAALPAPRSFVPIGRPLTNVSVYVLDEGGRPVPPGVAGELHIGGVGLARGYLNRPALTAERFIPNPFALEPGGRLYRTGDLARHTPDGVVEFLGRIDQQVKIRGFRIELGEIEAALGQHPQVRAAAVLARTDEPGGQRLVAYVVPQHSGAELYTLPNGLRVAHLNKNETDVLYKEVFEGDGYLRHGVTLRGDDVIFDVGANIGLFSLFVRRHSPNAKVYAFEPIPTVYEILKSNVSLHGLNVEPFNCGLSHSPGEATFTFYPKMSSMSGMYADALADERLTRAYLMNQGGGLAGYADELMEGRFGGERVVCPLRTISEVMREERIERIDLLKLDVERAELDVLRGIAGADWAKVKQVVAEVHDEDNRLEEFTDLLRRQGFEVVVEQDALLANTPLYNLYAVRAAEALVGEERAEAAPATPEALMANETAEAGRPLSISALRRYLRERLPEYMIPSAFVILAELPRLPNGKVDRKLLPAPEAVHLELEQGYLAPRTPIEELLAAIWSHVLGVERVGVNDNFFDLGGHSLLVTQVVTRVRAAFHIDLPLRSLFERPTVARLAETVEAALGEAQVGPVAAPLARADREGPLPLSFAQQRLWFLDQLSPGGNTYNIPRAFRFVGKLDLSVLERTLNEVRRRHEALRTTFAVVDGQPVQIIGPATDTTYPLLDLTDLPESAREARALELTREEAERAFDLGRGPLWHTVVARLGEEEFLVLFTMHHIISDGWSMGVLVREVAALYESFLRGRPSPLAELPVQYADFAVWQRQLLSGEFLEAQLAFWRTQLADSVTLSLPTDRPRPAVQSSKGAREFFYLTPELTGALHRLSRGEEVTHFMTLLAAFKVLLGLYSEQPDISVGTPVAGRQHVETEKLIGFFVNTLVLRTDLSGDPTFTELLGRVRETALGAYAHQDLPFELLVEELRPERSLSHTPLFQVVFSMQNVPTEVLELPEVTWSSVEAEVRTAKFDLTMNLMEHGGQLVGALEYNTDLFEHATIVTLLEQYCRVLELVTADPEARLSKLSLLTDESQRDLIIGRNETIADYPRDKTVVRLFEEQAARTPHAVAVVSGDSHLTYVELNEQAERVCRRLRLHGIGRGARVGLMLEHSVETVAAILGVLKSGAAYVPLDPAHPAPRLAFIAEDAALNLLLTQRELRDRVPTACPDIVCVEDVAAGADEEVGDAAPGAEAAPEDPVYVIYTSGSTGEPKGVVIQHRALVNYLWWARDVYLRGEQLDFPLYSSLAFDLTVTSIYTPLVTGNAVRVYRQQGAESPLEALLADNRCGVLKLTPSHLKLLGERDNRASSVRRLIVGGEALTTELARQVHESFGGRVEIYNEYGPTEATVGCMIYKYDPEGDSRAYVPIGRPAANVRIYVLDGSLRPTADNVPGDLYIAGDGLAAGYLNRVELTTEKFVADPYHPGEKMYRSGDRAKWLANGALEFLGRLDEQVKVRGFRVELGEIRSALNRHPLVRDSVVLVRKTAQGDDVLMAYYVSRHEVAAAELRDLLSATLIRETIPNLFVRLPRLPLTLNGKINYGALPTPEEARDGARREYVPPATPAEEAMAVVWAEVLGLERVGVTDNFFELGGHSLLIVRLSSSLRERLGKEVTVVSMFEYPTVRTLAGFLARAEGGAEAGEGEPERDAGASRKEAQARRRQLGAKRRAGRDAEAEHE